MLFIATFANLVVTVWVVSSNLALFIGVHQIEIEPFTATKFVDHTLLTSVGVSVGTLIASTFAALKFAALALTQLIAECASFPIRAYGVPRNMKQIRAHR